MIRRIAPLVAVVAVLIASLLVVGCAAEKQVKQAQRALDAATAVHADYLAPYQYASAENYLDEALSQLHESDFAAATKFAIEARTKAAEAERLARTAHATPMVPFSQREEGMAPPVAVEPAAPATPDAAPAAAPVVVPPPPPPPPPETSDEYPLGEPDDLPPVDEQGGE